MKIVAAIAVLLFAVPAHADSIPMDSLTITAGPVGAGYVGFGESVDLPASWSALQLPYFQLPYFPGPTIGSELFEVDFFTPNDLYEYSYCPTGEGLCFTGITFSLINVNFASNTPLYSDVNGVDTLNAGTYQGILGLSFIHQSKWGCGISGCALTLTIAPVATPEPSELWLLGVGVLALIGCRAYRFGKTHA